MTEPVLTESPIPRRNFDRVNFRDVLERLRAGEWKSVRVEKPYPQLDKENPPGLPELKRHLLRHSLAYASKMTGIKIRTATPPDGLPGLVIWLKEGK